MPRLNHYQLLGLARDASSIDIANAFREKLAEARSKPGAEDQDQAIREAFQVLSNPHARAEYDESLPVDPKVARKAKEPGIKEFVQEVLHESGVLRIVIPVALVATVGVIWYKIRAPRPTPPVAPIVDVSRKVATPPQRYEGPTVRETDAPPQPQVPESPNAPPPPQGPMTAEDIFAKVSGSTARIQTKDEAGKLLSQGSGVVVGSTIVITNCHVIADASTVSVKVGESVLEGILQVDDEALDLCSLRVAGLSAPRVSFSTSEPRVGQHVYAVGSPQGLELTLSEGLVSSLRPTSKGTIIQTTAPISPGSSGGGLFNDKAQLVGIVTFQHKSGQNLNFALPASWISDMQQRGATENVSAPIARSANSPQ